jgi:hypothetical protein
MSYTRRRTSYRKHWKELTKMYGSLCYWCREEVATCIDHYVPYSWDQDNSIENLVPSCTLCNVLAGSKLFESVDHKRQYILNKRRNKKHGILRCSECLVPFVQNEHSPSPFLCAHCYDEEYGTQECASKSWIRWLELLDTAEIPYLAHWEACKRGTASDRRQFVFSVIAILEMWEDHDNLGSGIHRNH